MSRDELRIAEAVASLTARLESWSVPDAAEKAHQFVHDMLRFGWRASAPRVETPTYAPAGTPCPPDVIAQARAAIAAAKEAAKTQETA